jgi:hypothetical protein
MASTSLAVSIRSSNSVQIENGRGVSPVLVKSAISLMGKATPAMKTSCLKGKT